MVTLSGLLGKEWVYRMPPFQRPYSWTEVQVERLVEDVRRATAYQDPHYFLGQMIVLSQDGEALVIDGQQRLATLTIMLAYLRDSTTDRALAHALQHLIGVTLRSELKPRLFLRPLDAEFFRDWVQTPGRIEALSKLKRIRINSQRLIQRAASSVIAVLESLTEEERGAMARFMSGRLTFNLIQTDGFDNASAIFRRINYEGLRPSESTIIRSELLEQARLSAEETERIADRWDRLEDGLSDKDMSDLWRVIEVVVSGLAPGERRDRRRPGLRAFENVDIANFVRKDMWRYIDVWRAVTRCEAKAGEASAEINRYIGCMQLYAHHEDAWIAPAVAMLADHADDKALLVRVFRYLERLTFACMMTALKDNQSRSTRFARIVRARGDERILFGRDSPLLLTRTQTIDLIKKLNSPLVADNSRGRVIAMRINAALPGGEVLTLKSDATLEHILPQSVTEFWLKKFPEEDDRLEYTYLIGNFALVTEDQNDAAANKNWEQKRDIYFNWENAPVRALTETVRQYKDWNENALRRRHTDLVDALRADLDLVSAANAPHA